MIDPNKVASLAARYMLERMSFNDISSGVPHIRRSYKTTNNTPNGKRECERRMKQIAKGQLKKENGLATSD